MFFETRTLFPVITLLAAFFAYTAYGYQCFELPFTERVDGARNIFVARITSIEKIGSGKHSWVYADFEVVERFKGMIPFDRLKSRLRSWTGVIDFVVDAEYLIFAHDDGEANISCGRSDGALRPADLVIDNRAAEDLALLREVFAEDP